MLWWYEQEETGVPTNYLLLNTKPSDSEAKAAVVPIPYSQ